VKLNIKIDQKTYEVEVEAVEPEAPSHAPRGYVMESAPVRVAAAPPVAPAPSGPVNEDRVCRRRARASRWAMCCWCSRR